MGPFTSIKAITSLNKLTLCCLLSISITACDGSSDSSDEQKGPDNNIAPTQPADQDNDGIADTEDADDDNDGINDEDDAFPLDPNESLDTDNDGLGNNSDSDDDNDNIADINDAFPLDANESVDTDNDGIGNNADTDDDNDKVADNVDRFPLNANEYQDTDNDGTGNNADTDDDNDNVADNTDVFPLDANESVDTDNDGTGNNADTDDDNDNVADNTDAFPLDANESVDTDNDGTGNNADTDDDNDNVADSSDAFPLDANESVDTDNDGTGNNADTDDDNDNVADGSDAFPLDANESVDTDNDGTGNNADTDDDNDNVADGSDAFPLDANESVDTDNDGTGNNTDTDDDNDNVTDNNDAFPLNKAASVDTDNDGQPDGWNFICTTQCQQESGLTLDNDNDNDGWINSEDDAPLDANHYDLTGPLVTNNLPLANGQLRTLTSNIQITFNEDLLESSVTTDNFQLLQKVVDTNLVIPTNFSMRQDNKTIYFSPQSTLKMGQTYQIKINKNVSDLLGNPMTQDFTFDFSLEDGIWRETSVLAESLDTRDIAIAQNASGSRIAIWSKNYGVSVRHYSSEENWTESFNIDSTNEVASNLSVEMDDAGNAIASWKQYATGSGWRSWAAYFSNGDGWQAPIQLSEFQTNTPPALAMNTAGYAVLTWIANNESGIGQVYSKGYYPNSGWQSTEIIDDASERAGSGVDVAMDKHSNLLVIWQQKLNDKYHIFQRRRHIEEGWGTVSQLDTGSSEKSKPTIVMNQNGVAFSSWQEKLNYEAAIWGNRFDPLTGWGTSTRINTGNNVTSNSSVNIELAVDDRGNSLVLWQQNFDGLSQSQLWSNQYVQDQGWLTSRLLAESSSSKLINHKIASDADGKAIALWEDDPRDNTLKSSLHWARFKQQQGWTQAQILQAEAKTGRVIFGNDGKAIALYETEDRNLKSSEFLQQDPESK